MSEALETLSSLSLNEPESPLDLDLDKKESPSMELFDGDHSFDQEPEDDDWEEGESQD